MCIDLEFLPQVRPINEQAMEQAQRYIDLLAKPIGSLGELETISARLAGIFGHIPESLSQRRMLVFCADNGVWNQGISPVPQSVTVVQAVNMTRGMTGMCHLAKCAGADTRIIDVGINASAEECAPIIDRKVRMGTADFTQGPAMTRAEAVRAINVGIEFARLAAADGIQVIGVGEMGICNTCSSSAVLSALTGTPPEITVGRGAGLRADQFAHKIECVRRAIEVNLPDPGSPLDVLSKVGGLDICAMVGAYIGAAESGIAAVVDGFIGIVSALCAVRLAPETHGYLFASHASAEPAFMIAAEAADLHPCLHLRMRLGEGSGCPIMMQVMDDATRTMSAMASFSDASIDATDYIDMRK